MENRGRLQTIIAAMLLCIPLWLACRWIRVSSEHLGWSEKVAEFSHGVPEILIRTEVSLLLSLSAFLVGALAIRNTKALWKAIAVSESIVSLLLSLWYAWTFL